MLYRMDRQSRSRKWNMNGPRQRHCANIRPVYVSDASGDGLFAQLRTRGLPIGNLTSQFWSNCYLAPLNRYIAQHLGHQVYLCYVDDMVLFSGSKR